MGAFSLSSHLGFIFRLTSCISTYIVATKMHALIFSDALHSIMHQIMAFGIIFGNVMHVRDGGQQKVTKLRRCSRVKNW